MRSSSPSRNGFGLARGKCEELHDGEEGIVMPSKKYVLKLSTEERSALGEVIRQPRSARWKVVPAWALLKCDQGCGGLAWSDASFAEALAFTVNRLATWRAKAVF